MLTRFSLLLLSVIAASTVVAQDYTVPAATPGEKDRRNAISVNVLLLPARAYSGSYARRFNNGKELTFTPLVQLAARTIANEPGVDSGSNHLLMFTLPDPQWYYTRYSLRTGLRFPIGRRFGYEPQIQLGYAQFQNKVIETKNYEGDMYDEYLRLDRKYFSAGIVNTINWVWDFDWFRIKAFAGLGIHVRRYDEMQWNRYVWSHAVPFTPQEVHYSRIKASLLAGLELGIRY